MNFGKIFKTGSSAVVVLPVAVLAASGLKIGDDIVICSDKPFCVCLSTMEKYFKEGEK